MSKGERKNPGVVMYVDPMFRAFVKSESAMKQMTIIDYTRELARSKSLMQEGEELNKMKGLNIEKRKPFSFRF